ncbi:MAG: hypothetical protein LBT32_09205 [Peptococcaceae bacterium]|jgi:hypothetical protein|nr:hypothetical protein [Peptococcaceae bacterium]
MTITDRAFLPAIDEQFIARYAAQYFPEFGQSEQEKSYSPTLTQVAGTLSPLAAQTSATRAPARSNAALG